MPTMPPSICLDFPSSLGAWQGPWVIHSPWDASKGESREAFSALGRDPLKVGHSLSQKRETGARHGEEGVLGMGHDGPSSIWLQIPGPGALGLCPLTVETPSG